MAARKGSEQVESALDAIAAAADAPLPAPDLRPTPVSPTPEPDRPFLPPDCPVTALGKDGLSVWVLDASKQILNLRPRDMGKGELLLMFGSEEYLIDCWPAFGKSTKKDQPPPIVGFNQADVQSAVVQACLAHGIFNPQNKVRGRGAHANDDGSLSIHLGAQVMVAGAADKRGKPTMQTTFHKAGKVGRFYYPAMDDLPPPAEHAADAAVARELRTLLGRWFWKQGEIAPHLMLGLVACMMICGVLDHRPHIWLTGPTAAGKSELQKLFKAILDTWALQSNDATEAAIRQILGQDTLPVLIDEAEADNDAEKQKRIINLARLAATGGQIYRGGADHKGQTFVAQSCFMFSSIIHGQLQPQDRNRIVILDMEQVPPGAEDLKIDVKLWRDAGRKLHRRMIEHWPRWQRTLADYCVEIHKCGFTGREQKLYGTLLAAADMLLWEVAPSQESEANEGDAFGRHIQLVQRILPLLRQARSEGADDRARCVAHLTSFLLPAISGQQQETVGKWLVKAYERDDRGEVCKWAREKLKGHGLKLVTITENPEGGRGTKEAGTEDSAEIFVAIAGATNAGLTPLFRGTEWTGGSWAQSMGRLDGAVKGLKVRFTGKAETAIAVPISQLVDLV